ncbi:MAG: hypothetical protein ABWZ52_12615 [Acidimicrobiales bacterium]
MDRHARRLLAALDREGVLLQHDQVLPSASAVVAGEPVRGSWWAHPMAHPIYDALNSIEDDGHAVRVKLVAGKVTMVARRLWPELLSAATEQATWQTARLTEADRRLLARVEQSTEPLVLDKGTREAGRRLEPTLLVFTDEVHLPSGRHAKALLGWDRWASSHGIEASASAARARASIEAIVGRWGSSRWLLPWPPS